MKPYSTSERTKQALIQAAGTLLAERGVGRVSTRAIAQLAGENIGTIHYHFGNKEGLLREALRYACASQGGPSLPDVIMAYGDRLDSVPGQVEAVRAMVHHLIKQTFSADRPRWCSRALYQVAQHVSPLRNFLREQMLEPFFEAIAGMIRRIRPEWTADEIHIWVYTAIGPIIFHADHGELVLDRLGKDTFPEEYLARLDRRLADDALRALGLPVDSSPVNDNPVFLPKSRDHE